MGDVLRRVTIGQTAAWIEIDKTKLLATLLGQKSEFVPSSRQNKPDILRLTAEFQVLRRGSEVRVIAPHSDSCFQGERVTSLVKAVARAHGWYEKIVAGEVTTIGQLAQKSGLTRRYVRRILQCSSLAPKIAEAMLTGKHRPNLTLKEIMCGVPFDWREQKQKILGQP
jgi:site-specific DNA recombinase